MSVGKRVVVVGGGLAGMTAAYELAKLGYEVTLLERGGHFGGKVMSSEGYGGMPIEHGVHGWWKGYGNFFDVLKEVVGPGFEDQIFAGPYPSRFTAKVDGEVFTTERAAPTEDEVRAMPFLRAGFEMIKGGVLSKGDAASLLRLLCRIIAFEHTKDYDEWKDRTASGVAEAYGVSRRAQQLMLANFTLASAFAPLDRVSAAAMFSSMHFYVFDAPGSLAARWLKSHPWKLVHRPICERIEKLGGLVVPYARVLGVDRDPKTRRVRDVLVDRDHTGVLDWHDFTRTERDLFDDTLEWKTDPKLLAIARATLRHLGHVWLKLIKGGDVPNEKKEAIAWTGDRRAIPGPDDPRRLAVEWADAMQTRVRVLEDRYERVGTIAASDVPEGKFSEMLWLARTGKKLATTPAQLEELRKNLASHGHLFAMHAADLTTPPHLPLYVGKIGGEARAFAGVCTHFGGRLRWDESLHAFACTLHGSRFRCDGQRTCGPAEADMFTFRLKPKDGDPTQLDVFVPLPPRIEADAIVLATDVSGLRRIVQASPNLHDAPSFTSLMRLRTTSVTVVRLVLGRTIDDHLVIFSGFDAIDAMFNVTKLQGVQLPQYEGRVHEVIELQLYRDRTIGELSREAIVSAIKKELREAYRWADEPEVLEPVHVAVHRDVYSAYDVESECVRPGTDPDGLDGLYFAGDWVQPDDGAWYMERAVRTGRLAARAIVRDAKEDPERVPLVPPVRKHWEVQSILRGPEALHDAVVKTFEKLVGIHDEPAEDET